MLNYSYSRKILENAVVLVTLLASGASLPARQVGRQANKAGDVLIADRFNHRVIELNPAKQIVWQFGNGSGVPGPASIAGPGDAERVGGLTLITGTGVPPGVDPKCPQGCPDNRVIAVNQAGRIVWQYGQAGLFGSGPNELNAPMSAVFLPKKLFVPPISHVLITDQGNHRVIEVDWNGHLVWQYGLSGMPGSGSNQLAQPTSAQLLKNGHILIADHGNNRVLEVDRNQTVVWEYDHDQKTGCPLKGPSFASRLPDGNTLITESGNNRVIEVNPSGVMVFLYNTKTRPGSVPNPAPTRAVRLKNGDTLISDQFNQQVIEINPAKEVVYSYGMIGVPLAGPEGAQGLNAPHDAKVVGDFTGLPTPCPH
jgi:hypothetical protein